jgi:hypothetical protein
MFALQTTPTRTTLVVDDVSTFEAIPPIWWLLLAVAIVSIIYLHYR